MTSSSPPRSVTAVDIPVIASGGAGNPEHVRSVLTDGGAAAALAASIFHFDAHPVPETKRYLRDHGVDVRVSDATSPDLVTTGSLPRLCRTRRLQRC